MGDDINNINKSTHQLTPNLSDLMEDSLDETLHTKNTNSTNTQITNDEKDLILEESQYSGIDINSITLGYGILLFMLIIFLPKIYLANNIYYASKNINYLQAQKESLKNENLELQKSLESTKFNFLTLDIEEIQ